jgi:signal transduction histidine kinase
MRKLLRIRWILLGMAFLAIVGLTGMNVYSLYALHESTVKATADAQKNQLADFSYTVRNRFRPPVESIWRLNMEQLHADISSTHQLPSQLADVLEEASKDPLFEEIYFAFPNYESCSTGNEIMRFDVDSKQLVEAVDFPEYVCDGFGLTRSRMNVLINDYRFNTKVVFDTHRSMTVALINPRGNVVVAYIAFIIDTNFLISDFLAPQLVEVFGSREQSGMTIWLHDWVRNEVLAVNDDDVEYNRRNIQYIQRFPDLLDNWNLKVLFDKDTAAMAAQTALVRNLIVLSGGVVLLIGSLLVMFIISQRERSLVDRQAGFIANVTHELKTPLAVMQAAGENLADGRVKDPERLKTYGQHIHNESLRLRSMIEKLLDVARSDAGQHQIKPAVYNIADLIESYLAENKSLIAGNNFEPHVEIEENVPPVFVDKDSFATILGNLVENAMKYSSDEKYLGIRVLTNGKMVVLEVEDHGHGIPSKAQKHIFDKFYRVEDPLTARTKGHGLGLSIVKTHVLLNGGKIDVKSNYRKGSIFSVQFPKQKVSENAAKISINSESKVEYAN